MNKNDNKFIKHKPLTQDETKNLKTLIYCAFILGCIFLLGGFCLRYLDYSSTNYEPDYFGYLLLILSGIFFIGTGFLVKHEEKANRYNKYKKMTERKKIDATVYDFVGSRNTKTGKGGYEIWAITNKDFFISPTINENIPKYVKIGDHIPVYVNPNNIEEYYMDIDNIH